MPSAKGTVSSICRLSQSAQADLTRALRIRCQATDTLEQSLERFCTAPTYFVVVIGRSVGRAEKNQSDIDVASDIIINTTHGSHLVSLMQKVHCRVSADRQGLEQSYRSVAVIHHLGPVLDTGHYTASLRTCMGWVNIDDDDEPEHIHRPEPNTAYVVLYAQFQAAQQQQPDQSRHDRQHRLSAQALSDSISSQTITDLLTRVVGSIVQPELEVDAVPFRAALHRFKYSGSQLRVAIDTLSRASEVVKPFFYDDRDILFQLRISQDHLEAWQHLRLDRHTASPIFNERIKQTPFTSVLLSPSDELVHTPETPKFDINEMIESDSELLKLQAGSALDPVLCRAGLANGPPVTKWTALQHRVVTCLHQQGVDPSSSDMSCSKEIAVRGPGYFRNNPSPIGVLAIRGLRLPELVDLLDLGHFGRALVLHQPIAGHSPHILLGRIIDTVDYEEVEVAMDNAIAALKLPIDSSYSVTLSIGIHEAPIVLRHDGLAHRRVIDTVIAPALRQARQALRIHGKGRQPFNFTEVPAPNASLPRIARLIAWARISDEDESVQRSHERVARQVLSMLDSPPVVVDRRFTNVEQVHVILESCSSWRHPLSDRRAFQTVTSLLMEGAVVLVVNLDRATRRLSDLELLNRVINDAGARFFVQSSLQVRPDSPGETSDNASPEDEDDWTELTSETMEAAREHLTCAKALSDEHAFYTDSALILDRVLVGDTASELVRDYRSALAYFALRQGLRRVVLLCRTSESGSENSLRRQKTWLTMLMPPDLEVIDCILDAQSATLAPVTYNALEALHVTDALILFTSVDRLTRKAEHLVDLRQLASSRHLAFVGTCWRAQDHPLLLAEVEGDPRRSR